MLEVRDVTMEFDGIVALRQVSFAVAAEEIVALIGPNGAGKTTMFNVITGFLRPTNGEIFFMDQKITGLKPHDICRKGMARTFQIPRLFKQMTVFENVKVGCHPRTRSEIFSCGFRTRFCEKESKEVEGRSLEILYLLGLDKERDTLAENLPIGEQKLLEIARALATSPAILLLDEPAGGLNNRETRRLAETIVGLRDNMKITLLLVEHDMSLVMRIADRIIVLNYGEKIAEGPPQEIRKNDYVIAAYLGRESV